MTSRNKLVQLYGRGLPLGNAVVARPADEWRQRCVHQRADAAHRTGKHRRDGGTTVESDDVSEALDDMMFAGGKLNVKLLGGAREMVDG
jgi:hypothetical protein